MWGEMARIIYEVRPKFVFVENSPMLTSRGLGRVLGDLASMGFDAKWGVLGAADIGAPHQRDRIWIVGKATNSISIRLQKSTNERKLESQGSNQLQIEQPRNSSEMANTSELFSDGGNNNTRVSLERQAQSKLGNDCGKEFVAYTRLQRGEARIANPKGRQKGKPTITNNCGYDMADTSSIYAQGQHSRSWEIQFGRKSWWAVEPNVGRVADGMAARVDRLKAIGNGQVPLCAATAWRILSESL
jgi:DNA (cytosine-5)-methyltransferase 1